MLALAAAFSGAGSAHAAVPCRDRVFNDWYGDGRISSNYPVACYRDALKHIPPDAQIYSSLAGDIKAALQAAIERLRGAKVPSQVGHGLSAFATSGASARPGLKMREEASAKGPAAVASATSSTPLPILVLGGIALALVAAGAIGAGVREVRRRSR